MKNQIKFRVGSGYDVHKLESGLRLVVGGVEVEHTHGLVAHSDGDVLVHAVCDALLGALALGDIGGHFSDQDDKFRGVDSCELLRAVCEMVRGEGWEICNVDSIIVAQRPKFAGYIERMRGKMAEVMGVDVGQVSVKATTTEKLGFEGREEGISAHATVMVQRVD